MMNEGTSDNGQPAEMPAWKLARAETGCMNGACGETERSVAHGVLMTALTDCKPLSVQLISDFCGSPELRVCREELPGALKEPA